MEEQFFIKIKSSYEQFRAQLMGHINNPSITLDSEDCYLILEDWENKLKECFDSYDSLQKQNNENTNLNDDILKKNKPVIINNFSEITRSIIDKKKYTLISKKIIEYIYGEEYIKDKCIIKYYSGNNKLIIEYNNNKDNNNSKALLLINPFNNHEIYKNMFIILIYNNEKNILYKKILSEKIDFNFEFKQNNNIIIPIYLYLYASCFY